MTVFQGVMSCPCLVTPQMEGDLSMDSYSSHLSSGDGQTLNNTFSAVKGYVFKKERREGRGEARKQEKGSEGKATLLVGKQKEHLGL